MLRAPERAASGTFSAQIPLPMPFPSLAAALSRGPLRFRRVLAVLACCACLPAMAQQAEPAQDPAEAENPFAFHGQSTYIWQRKPAFNAAYSGPNSLGTERPRATRSARRWTWD